MTFAALRSARLWRAVGVLAAVALAATSPLWGRRTLGAMAFFRVRSIELEGARYLAPSEVLGRLRVDTSQSVWMDARELERRIARHPQVRSVEVRRRLPGTLVVRVTEHLPVALAETPSGLAVFDAEGRRLPVDPSRVDLDVPVLPRRDTVVLRFLAELRERDAALFARVSEARRVRVGGAPHEIQVVMPPLLVRLADGASAARFADILPVERDLARRRVRAGELDLRFRDQVIARLQ